MNYHLEDERELLQETKTTTYSWPRNTMALSNKNNSSTFIYMEREGRRERKREMEMEGEGERTGTSSLLPWGRLGHDTPWHVCYWEEVV